MSVDEALTIARASACKDAGNITSAGAVYNNNSNTWWLAIDRDMPGCNPACVVYASRSAEVNYRCTGVIVYTVKAANSTLGEILVDNGGYSLYSFTPDTSGVSTCYGSCAATWPPLLVVDTISIPNGLDGTFGASARTDNSTQVTYNGMPLYTYSGDSAPGDTNGDGLNGKWYVVPVSG
jgi:predicted lipoprotein with Yx(FWY)xxD motif